MFSHVNLAIFTKNGTLLPINHKGEIIIALNDDYGEQAVFYPVTAEDESGVFIQGYKKVYGGRFVEKQPYRVVAIMRGENVDYRNCAVTYEPIHTNNDTTPLYTITEIDIPDTIGVYDSALTFPNVTFSQKMIFDKVSTELFETEFLYVMAEITDPSTHIKTYKKISSIIDGTEGLPYETVEEIRAWAERYNLLFFIDSRYQKDFRVFTVYGDEAVWSDRAEIDLATDTLTLTDGTEADHPAGWPDDKWPLEEGEINTPTRSPRVDIGFSGENEGVYREALHICLLDSTMTDEEGIPKIIPIGEIELIAEAEGEDERYRTLFTNFGIPDPKFFDHVYKDSYIDDDKPDFRSINRHSKEMFLEYDKIFPYVGTYRALINAVHLLGYDDIFFKEWYKVLDVSDEIPRGYVAYDMSYKNSGHNHTLAKLPLEKRIHLRKKNWLSMMYSLNREIYGAPDEYDFPYVEELFEYRTEDSLIKLIYLREWLEKYVLALNCRIIDVGGEGVYFERYAMNAYGGARMNLEHIANLNVIPSVEDASLSDTAVLIDSSAFITVEAKAKMLETRLDDLKNLRLEDFCDGVITEDGIYHTYDGNLEGRYVGTTFAGLNNRYIGRLNAVSTVDDFIIGEDGYISDESPRVMISGNEISFIPEDIVYKEKNTAFKRMPVIALERAVLRSFTDTWEKPIRYLVYPENDPDTGVSYFIENKMSRTKVGSFDYVYLVPPTFEETEDDVTIFPKNGAEDASAVHAKKKRYNFTSDFGGVAEEYTSDDTTYGFRFSANNAYEIPLFSIQGYSLKRPVQLELPVNQEFYLDIIKGKLIFDDFEHRRKIYVIFDTAENGERSIKVKFSYFSEEFDFCTYTDNDGVSFDYFDEGSDYSSFLELYDEDTDRAVDFELLKTMKVYNSGEFKVNLTVRDVYGEVYSADAHNTAKVVTLQPLITAYTNEQTSNNEYMRDGSPVDASVVSSLYDKFCYFWYKTKYPVIESHTSEYLNGITYPVYPYSGDSPVADMTAHYANLSDKFKVVAYDKFITHDDRLDWNYYLILNRQNRHKNTRILEKNDKGAINEMYSGDIHVGLPNMANKCSDLFEDADRLQSENLDVTVMFYNEVGAFPVIQLPGKILNAKALDILHAGNPFQGHQGTPYGYFEDEYHLLLSHDITDCYVYAPSDNLGRITSLVDASGNITTGLSFMQDGVEWLVKSLFSEGYGSLWEYDFIPTRVTSETIMGKRYAYDDVRPEDRADYSISTVDWDPREFEDLPWISGWLTYKGNPILSKTFIDLDTSVMYNMDFRIPAGNVDSSLRYRVPSFDASFGDNSVFFPYYAIKPRTLMDTIPDLIKDPNISTYIYPYWQSEVYIVGVSENRVYIQFENSKYKFPRAFKPGELVKLIWRTGDSSNNIAQSSYKVIGYDNLGFVLILEGEINSSYAVVPGKKYAYAKINDDDYTSSSYGITDEDWNPSEYEDMPFVDGKEGWITGWLTYNGSPYFRYIYDPVNSYYRDHPELYLDGSVGTRHLHVFKIPAGRHIDPETGVTTIWYRVYSHDDLKCPYCHPDHHPSEGIGVDENGMFSPYYYIFDNAADASLYISYAYNAFSDYKMQVTESAVDANRVSVSHPVSHLNDKLTYFIDDTFKAVYRTFDTDNGILYWMNSEEGAPLICGNDVYAYNCPVTTYEKTPYTAFNIDYRDIPEDNRQTILWRVYKSVDAKEKALLFESWNRSLFLDILKRGIYDIEVNEFDKYGNRSVHMYEGAYRILPEEQDEPVTFSINAEAELIEGEGEYGYITGAGVYEEGTLCVLKAVAYNGYEFLGWTIDGTYVDTNSMLMFVVSNACDIKAKFRPLHYTLNVTVNDETMGSVTVCPDGTFDGDEYPFGTRCTVTAIPNAYPDYSGITYKFLKWECNGEDVSNDPEYTFTINDSMNLVAIFTERTFNISVRSNNTTYGTAAASKMICMPGEYCKFTAIPTFITNYEFVGWFENGTMLTDMSDFDIKSVERDYDLTAMFKVKKAKTCKVNFVFSPSDAKGEYQIYVNGEPPYKDVWVNQGEIINLSCRTKIENPSLMFVGWYAGSKRISTSLICSYTVQLPVETITAKFAYPKYTVSCIVDEKYGTSQPVTVNRGGTAVVKLHCNTLYEYNDMEVTGKFSQIDTEISGDPYVYTFTVHKVESDVILRPAFVIRNDYEPFYFQVEHDGGMKVGVNDILDLNDSYFLCQIEGTDEILPLDPKHAVEVEDNKKLYIWTKDQRQRIRQLPNDDDALAKTTLFYVHRIRYKQGSSDEFSPFNIGGNIMSLLVPRKIGNTYVKYRNLTLSEANNACFYSLFAFMKVQDAGKLILPANTAYRCYYYMFNLSEITVGPTLRAKKVCERAYESMFVGCKYIKEVTTYQESWLPTDNVHENSDSTNPDKLVPVTVGWLENANTDKSSRFHKTSVLTVTRDTSHIPEEWTIVEDIIE